MKFLINTANLKSGGALQVAASLLEEWNLMSFPHDFYVILSPQLAAHIATVKLADNFKIYYLKSNPNNSFKSWNLFKKIASKIIKEQKIDAVLTVFGPALWQPKQPHLIGFANGFYLFRESTFIQHWLKQSLLQKAQYIIKRFLIGKRLKSEGDFYWVETEDAKRELEKLINNSKKEIVVIGNTASKNIYKKQEDANQQKPFKLLYLSAYYPHKNFEIIDSVIKLLDASSSNCQILLSLEQSMFEKLFGKNPSKKLVNLGPINFGQLAETYQKADAIFMPSLLETFSANYPEAMKAEIPILCSDTAFAHNICQDAALYFDPYNAKDIVEKIEELSNNKHLQEQLINAGKNQLKQLETPFSRAKKILKKLEQIGLIKNS